MVPNTSELLPEPEMPVNTVSRRFGSSTLTSLRLLTRAPCTRIRSWLSAVGSPDWAGAVFFMPSRYPRPGDRRFSIRDRSGEDPSAVGPEPERRGQPEPDHVGGDVVGQRAGEAEGVVRDGE